MAGLNTDVEYFLAIASHGSLVRAAQSLGLTQPALTKAVRRLEQALGVALFTRSARGSELTEAGQAFYTRVKALSNAMDDAVLEARDLGGGHAGLLRLGITPGVSHFVLTALFPALSTERPAAVINLTTAFGDVVVGALQRQELAMAVCPLPEETPPDLISEALYDDPFSAIVSARHPLASRTELTLKDLAAWPWVASGKHEFARRSIEQALARQGLPLMNVRVETNSLVAVHTVVARTQMVSLFNARHSAPWALPPDVVVIPVSLPGVARRVGVLRRPGYISPIAERALQILRAAAQA
ncbi:MAG: LysR family transcriptional regulator [Rubrivivax sp.]|nr:MAG: LysR family transcriptional regulator [Rubrivivax sp.]